MSNDAGALDLGGVDIGEAKAAADGGDVKSENLHVEVGLEVSNPIAPSMVDDFGVMSHHNADDFSSFKTPGFSLSDSRFRIMAGVDLTGSADFPAISRRHTGYSGRKQY